MSWHRHLLFGLSLVAFAAQPTVAPPVVHHFQLPNGLPVSLVERHDRPLVRAELRVSWPMGSACTPATLTALQRLLLAREGGPYDAEGFTRGMEDAGAKLTFKAEHQALSWQMVAPSSEQDIALGLLAHRALHPILSPQHLEEVRRELRRGLRQASLSARAKDRFLGIVGAPAPLLGAAEDALDRLNLDALIAAHRILVQPSRAHLVLYGDVSLDQARQAALLHFGAWGKPSVPEAVHAAPTSVPRWVVAPESGRPLELWLAFGSGSEDTRSLALLGAGLKQHWKQAPAPFRELECSGGEEGLLVFRFKASAKVASLEAVLSLRKELERLRTEGLPQATWLQVLQEALNQRAAEHLHPAAWVARLARHPGDPIAPRIEDLNRQLRGVLSESNLTGLILGAGPHARAALAAAGVGPLLWMDR